MDNINEHFESTEDEKVHHMLSALKRVGAPKDFEFRIKARIAQGRPAAISPSRIPVAVRFAIPLALVLLVGAYFGINALYSPTIKDVPAVAETKPAPPIPVSEPAPQPVISEPAPSTLKDERAVTKVPESVNALPKSTSGPNSKSVNRKVDVLDKKPGGGSFEDTSHSNPTILPKGINPNGKPPTKPEDFNKNTQVPAGEVLSMIGIDGKFAGHGWRVDSVRKNSKAEHLGLKAGDVVEAINDRKLAEKTGFESGFEGKTLRVIRDGKPVQVQIKP